MQNALRMSRSAFIPTAARPLQVAVDLELGLRWRPQGETSLTPPFRSCAVYAWQPDAPACEPSGSQTGRSRDARRSVRCPSP